MPFFSSKDEPVRSADALPGRSAPIPTAAQHAVFDRPLSAEVPEGMTLETAIFAMGCFWGVERIFWQLPGVYMTMVGYTAGFTPNPTYEEVCTGKTGHTEAVLVLYDPAQCSYADLLKVFWENHDPTQGMRQGNDRGTQYRSGVYTTSEAQIQAAQESARAMAPRLEAAGHGEITTEIVPASEFYHAEGYHQQYLHKNPDGYCGIGGTGVTCPIGIGA